MVQFPESGDHGNSEGKGTLQMYTESLYEGDRKEKAVKILGESDKVQAEIDLEDFVEDYKLNHPESAINL
jgi:hypothetical protein